MARATLGVQLEELPARLAEIRHRTAAEIAEVKDSVAQQVYAAQEAASEARLAQTRAETQTATRCAPTTPNNWPRSDNQLPTASTP